jgi:hypothetical protein
MRKSTIIVENFYSEPEAVVTYAKGQRYYYPYQKDDDVMTGRAKVSWMSSWFKSAGECPFKSSRRLIEKLELLTGDTIDMDRWNSPFPVDAEGKAARNLADYRHRSCFWNCCFHFKPRNNQQLGEGVHNHVTDSWNSVGENGWAGLIYLSWDAPLRGGLRTWRNRDPLRVYDWMTPKENWEMVDDIGNVFNRLILCRGNIPHSGHEGWGDSLENGRIYQTFFFRVKNSEEPGGFSLRSENG